MNKSTITQKAEQYQRDNPSSTLVQAWMAGYNCALRYKSREKQLDLSFIDADFCQVMTIWMEYKKERNQTYTQIGIEACYKKIMQLSGGNPQKALAIVEQSISNNWAGLFELKNGNIGTAISVGYRQVQSAGQRKASVDELAGLAEGILQGIGFNERK